jgi:hypothetical protein
MWTVIHSDFSSLEPSDYKTNKIRDMELFHLLQIALLQFQAALMQLCK